MGFCAISSMPTNAPARLRKGHLCNSTSWADRTPSGVAEDNRYKHVAELPAPARLATNEMFLGNQSKVFGIPPESVQP